ncbi:MAG: ferredoxin--NADP reductase [Candidatus Eisenbacteria bacterium]
MGIEYNATLTRKEIVTGGLVILGVRPDRRPYEFEPGQYTVLALKGSEPRVMESETEAEPPAPEKLVKRAYSIASGSDENELEFFVVLVSTGALTPRLLALEVGARLFVSPKAVGVFTLDSVPPDRDVVMVATGTGLAPYISMLRTKLTEECGGGRCWAVLHGARHSWDLGYRSELSSFQKICSNFFYMPSITRTAKRDPWSGPVGRVNEFIADGRFETGWGRAIDSKKQHFFLCGNPGMVEETAKHLETRGFSEWNRRKNPDGTIHLERYW